MVPKELADRLNRKILIESDKKQGLIVDKVNENLTVKSKLILNLGLLPSRQLLLLASVTE